MLIYEEKKRLRKTMKALRSALPKEDWQERSARIVQNLKALEKFQSAKVIHAFISDEKRQEANLIPLLEWIISTPKKLLVPVIERNDLISVELASLNDLTPHTFGVLEPTERVPSLLEQEIDLVLVPLLAVDKRGNRLGYGKGYYDRFFKRLSPSTFKLGVAFEFQVLDEVPTTESDVRLDAVMTENGFTRVLS
ncbi:MAG: 5-formyltetrahydrofolate cyclo-ligase [Chloroherpetonaceae bacterium]